jgi:predicted DsbA family dithiol-disulfide isomerase
MQRVKVTVFTDPGCPFGFTAQRQDAQLQWHYGHGIDVTFRMIVVAEKSSSFEARGLKPGSMAATASRLRRLYGMPLVTTARLHVTTLSACTAYVGARMQDPERAPSLLRALYRRAFSDGQLLDDMETIRGAARDAGIATHVLDAWLEDAEVNAALREDMAAARSPLPEALALAHRLSKSNGSLRYSTGSAVYERDGRRFAVPGFQPFAVHEVAMANVAPQVRRRPLPENVEEILAWAPYPLATAEVAELRGTDLVEARAELEGSGAQFTPAAGDGYWTAS